jgi:alpha-D-xyloside xylohydrolase
MKQLLRFCLIFCLAFAGARIRALAQYDRLVNEPVDISPDFRNFANTYFLADSLADFDPATATGHIKWQQNKYIKRMAFDNELAVLHPDPGFIFPGAEYATNPELPFSLQFVSPRTVRIRMQTGLVVRPETKDSFMLAGEPPIDHSWVYSKVKNGHRYTSAYGSVIITTWPWHIEFRDAAGHLVTSTNHATDDTSTFTPIVPFSFVRRAADYSRSLSAAWSLQPGEKIFGCGESFTRLDKRGQKVVLWTDDANGVQNTGMYKPIPFFMSSNGYGMFMHTSTPITCDFGAYFNGVSNLMIGDDALDLFVFLGKPADILDEYTNVTGKSPMPPLWSFGLWMSRITYSSEDQVRDVAAKLRHYRIPDDVIHLDVGWFETDWRSDYEFSTTRFRDPQKMINDLKDQGFHISLWQLPYFVPKNKLFAELLQKGLFIRDAKGNLPYEDAMLDFSNPAAVTWYQEHLAKLLKMGVGAIKVDFGEAAPNAGLYASGRTGFYEHNLYPLRYNKAVGDITRAVTGENIIWARSAWAGSQRYPLHWGGDAANTSSAMSTTLRGGLSFGLSGFSFWSHDIGGFVIKTPEDLYRRWAPFGLLTSHSRCHGFPPKEPWAYSAAFLEEFREDVDLKYRLMPYIYAQAKYCSEHGLPMVRALFVQYPDDPGAWLVDDEYLFGSDILVAPLMLDSATGRNVYLPGGNWIDYQTKKSYGPGWQHIQAGKMSVVMLVRDGAVIPHIALAQSTMQMDWSKIELVVFSTGASETNREEATGLICLPSDNVLHPISVINNGGNLALKENPLQGRSTISLRSYNQK